MATVDTIKAISANIEAILTGLGWQLEDLSSNPDTTTTNFTRLDYSDEEFEDLYGERPSRNIAGFSILVIVNRKSPGLSRIAQQEAVHALRGAINVTALNAGALAGTETVTFVRHDGAAIKYEPPFSKINYVINIRYREG